MSIDTAHAQRPINPFCATVDGRYVDDLVEVYRHSEAKAAATMGQPEPGVRTKHFVVRHTGDRVVVGHRLGTDRIDDDLAGLLSDELFTPGWLSGPDLFERIFTGVVRSMTPEPIDAWRLFYANTLTRIDEVLTSRGRSGQHGTVSDYAAVYGRAERELAPGSVIELGSCFGFLSLRLATAGRRTMATDLCDSTMRLLDEIGARLGIRLTTMTSDAAHLPLVDRYADNVVATHLLEHLPAEHGQRVIDEAIRLAARRVILAVPLEQDADETWGHLRTISLADLTLWGAATGRPFRVFSDHGGWLVIDTSG